MEQFQEPTQIQQGIAKLEAYNDAEAARVAQALPERSLTLRELAKKGATALVIGTLAVGGALELGSYLTRHSSAHVAAERLEQPNNTVSVPAFTVPTSEIGK